MSQTYTQKAPLMLGLLEILAAKNGCMYLSDLAGKGRSAVLSHHLWEIDVGGCRTLSDRRNPCLFQPGGGKGISGRSGTGE